MSHSPTVYARGMQLDFQGILLLMWGSTVPLAYYHFGEQPWCRQHTTMHHISSSSLAPVTATIYGAVTTALALLCSLATFHPGIGGPRLGHARAVLFAAFGVGSFLVPVGHGVWAYGWAAQSRRLGLPWIGVTVLCNGVGVVLYAFKVRTYAAACGEDLWWWGLVNVFYIVSRSFTLWGHLIVDTDWMNVTDTREMVPQGLRHLRGKPSDHAHHGRFRGAGVQPGCVGGIRLQAQREEHGCLLDKR